MKTKRDWQGIFDSRNRLLGIAEEYADGWHIYVAGRDVGVVQSPEMARELIDRVNSGGSDESHR